MGKKITICGSGTAGLITALTLRNTLPYHEITVVSSSKIGIIGVGEGSTEHWRQFCDSLHMDKAEMVMACKATHKYGIYYENWTKHTPFYFHSIALESRGVLGYSGNYSYALENDMLLTNISSQPLINDTVISCHPDEVHNLTNQFHFDTFKLRILINYMNLHINTSGIFTHIILISLFVYLIFLLINNVIGLEQPPTQLTENQKIKLKYKLDILTLIIYIFLCIFVIVF